MSAVINYNKEIYKPYQEEPDVRRYPSAKMSEIAGELAVELKTDFRKIALDILKNSPDLPVNFRLRFLEKEWDVPLVEIYDNTDDIKSRLSDFDYAEAAKQIFPDEVLLVIRLPEPMEGQIKPDESVSEKEKLFKHALYNLYSQTVSRLWQARDQLTNKHNVQIERLNLVGKHEPGQYYYLWLLFPQGRESVTTFPSDHPGTDYPEEEAS